MQQIPSKDYSIFIMSSHTVGYSITKQLYVFHTKKSVKQVITISASKASLLV